MSDNDKPLLEIRDLHVSLPTGADRIHAVEGVSLSLARNEILCVVGESGSGKSLTARAVMGLLPGPLVRATGGEIEFLGEDLLKASEARMRAIRGDRISMIFQEPMTALNPLMSVGKQIDEVLRIHSDLSSKARRARIVELFREVQLPDPEQLVDSYPHQLSGGQRQRAMIAMALSLEPQVLIADEPTTALDVTTQAQILKLIKDLQAQHHTGVMFITHDFGVVAEIADRVAVMQHGRLVEAGSAQEVLHNPQETYTQELLAAVPSLIPRASRETSSESVLRSEQLVKTFRVGGSVFGGGRVVPAVKQVDIQLHRGETLGIVGESGSGKSTLARCLIRLLDADDGKILLGDTDLRPLSRRQLKPHRQRMQMVFQDPYSSLNPRYTVGRLIAEGPITNGVSAREAHAKARELLELVGLEARAAERYPHEFSGGQRQRIGIARALAMEPRILVADEPVSALDVSVQAQVLRLLAQVREQFQLSMLFITHDLRVAAQVCDRIAVMRYGEVVEHGPTATVFADPQHEYTQQLFAAVPGRTWEQRGSA